MPQMADWCRKKINTIGDHKGLKVCIGTGLGGKAYARAGGISKGCARLDGDRRRESARGGGG